MSRSIVTDLLENKKRSGFTVAGAEVAESRKRNVIHGKLSLQGNILALNCLNHR